MKNWYALSTKSRSEKVVAKQLDKQGYEIYLPLQKQLRRWKDRKKFVEMPLISGYIFCHIEQNEMYDVLQTEGSVRFLFFNSKPAVIRDEDIQSIKILLQNEAKIEFECRNNINKGDKVMILEGAFVGVCGYVRDEKNNKFAVYLEAFRADLITYFDKHYLTKVLHKY